MTDDQIDAIESALSKDESLTAGYGVPFDVVCKFARAVEAALARAEPIAAAQEPAMPSAIAAPLKVRQAEGRTPVAAAPDPVAWMRDAGEPSISTMAHCIPDVVKEVWLKANPAQVERYTIPLYAAPPSNAADVRDAP